MKKIIKVNNRIVEEVLKTIENDKERYLEFPKLLAELSERINSGEIRLNVFDCCYLMKCFNFIRKQIEEKNTEKTAENQQPTSQIQVNNLNILTIMVLHLLKKDNLLCPNHHKFVEEISQKEIEASKIERKQEE
ncbi:6549_t:CDS:2 [Entrophospora sp. SA101]|nr:12118_t:CDS:2 [Entrophospora sp. SA101]CAJ0885470.1 6549_t:CDS:2 [Entrophospora sp. SA101]